MASTLSQLSMPQSLRVRYFEVRNMASADCPIGLRQWPRAPRFPSDSFTVCRISCNILGGFKWWSLFARPFPQWGCMSATCSNQMSIPSITLGTSVMIDMSCRILSCLGVSQPSPYSDHPCFQGSKLLHSNDWNSPRCLLKCC